MDFANQLAIEYVRCEKKEFDWTEFLRRILKVREELGLDPYPFDEFLEIMETTSYPDEKQSYQKVEIHCDYAAEIEETRGGAV